MSVDHVPQRLRCPACEGTLDFWRAVAASEPTLRDATYELWRCRACGSAVTARADPAETKLHESGAYRPGAPHLHRAAGPLLRAFDRRRLAMLAAQAPPPARLLDAGAGRGRFVLAARDAGYDAAGIEPSRRGADAARAIGAPVKRASIERADVRSASLDVVTLWHVLEHLDDPAGALARITSWLEPGGVLLIGVPNLGSLQARVGGARWYHLDVPRHRVHFTETGLRALLRRQGFEVLGSHHVLLEHNPFGMWQSLVNRVTREPSYLYNLLKRNARASAHDLLLTALALPLAPFAALAELMAGAAGRGGTIAVLAKPRAD